MTLFYSLRPKRHMLQPLLPVLLYFGALANAFSAPPQPDELRLVRYSDSNAELFWSRSALPGLSYEVSRNAQLVNTTDGISYYDPNLRTNGSYQYAVVAIDASGERSVPATVSTGGDITTLAAPDNLRAIVYSNSAAELFWDRPEGEGLAYEIRRDGMLLQTTYGISFFDAALVDASAHRYAVVAINAAGERSAPSVVTLDDQDDPDNPPPDTSVPPPGNIRLDVYSATAIELFWDRVNDQVLSYEIKRNGVLSRTTNGTSHFDGDLNEGESYTYQITALNASGERSDTVEISHESDDTDGPGDDPDGPRPPITGFDLSADPAADIAESSGYYQRDGYADLDVIRVDIRTETTPGVCTVDDLSGCTLDDLLADIDKTDELKVEIAVHVKADDFADDGSVSNATMRMRGGGSRLGAQKSFRVKLDSKENLWRNERFLQLNKTPFDASRMRNSLSFKAMSEIPHLPSIRTQFVNLWIDDGDGPVDQGLYHHVERINETYLANRSLDDDGNLYDAEDFTFSLDDLSDLAVDEDGAPINEDFFESALGISEGKDHRPLIAMLRALNDPDRSFESVLDQYFDRNNALAWMATNLLLRQYDSVRHNYYLFNPSDSEKFYFLPWDYDLALGDWEEPPNSVDEEALRLRLSYGYAVGEPNVFMSKFYRLPGIHTVLLGAVDYIRQNFITDDFMLTQSQVRMDLVEPFQLRQPDQQHNPNFNTYSAINYANGPRENAEAMRFAFSIPLPPTLYEPQKSGDSWVFSWKPAFDVTGHSLSYDLSISTTPGFKASDVIMTETGIEDASDTVTHSISASRLSQRDYYVRLIARVDSEPDRFWQVSLNPLVQGGERYRGVLRFDVTD